MLDPIDEDLTLVDDFPNLGDGVKDGVLPEDFPVGIVAQQPRCVLGYVLTDELAHLCAERPEHLTLLGYCEFLEDLQIGGVHWE